MIMKRKQLKFSVLAVVLAVLSLFYGCSKDGVNTSSWKVAIPFEYDSITISPNGTFITVEQNGKYGIYQRNGESYEEMFPIQYDNITWSTQEDFVFLTANKQTEVFKKDKSKLFPNSFANIWDGGSSQNFIASDDGIHFGYLNQDGTWILKPEYTTLIPFTENRFFVTRSNGKQDLIDADGNSLLSDGLTVSEPFQSISCLDVINEAHQHGICDLDGTLIVPAIYSKITVIEDNNVRYPFLCTKSDNTIDIYGRDRTIFMQDLDYDDVKPINEEIVLVKRDDLYGVISKENDIIMPIQYPYIEFHTDDGYGILLNEEGYQLINLQCEIITDRVYDNIRPGSGAIRYEINGKYGYLKANGKELTPPEYDFASITLENGLLFATKDEKAGYLNSNGDCVIDFKFSAGSDFYEGYARVVEDGKLGVINTDGTYVIPPEYDPTTSIGNLINAEGRNGLMKLQKNQKWGVAQIINPK